MRVVIQRVSHASVTIEGVCKSAIKEGSVSYTHLTLPTIYSV